MEYLSDKDTETHKVCGTCGCVKPVDDFYKDGKTPEGEVRHRRDCKECYKESRMQEAILKAKRGASL